LTILEAALQRSDPQSPVPNTATPKHRNTALSVPLFGVCLGHQAIGHVAGGEVSQARNIMHGKTSLIRHDGEGLFEGMPNPFRAVRYHSLVLTRNSVPKGFVVTATAEDDGEIMGLKHESLPIEGVQFHPESVLTEEGLTVVRNFVRMVDSR
jgi:anthranilate synthase/aminodeoxychorismate synthase-like glutamine amidotransferase